MNLEFEKQLSAPIESVWDALIDSEKYQRWAKAFSPNSQFTGDWQEGGSIEFSEPGRGGTRAIVEDFAPYTRMRARHVSIVRGDGSEDVESEDAKKWIGTTETYSLRALEGSTQLLVEIETHEDFGEMFKQSWPEALELLREVCES